MPDNPKSYERKLLEFVGDRAINDAAIQTAFSNLGHLNATPNYIVKTGINDEDPPPFQVDEGGSLKSRGVVVVWSASPGLHDDKRLQAVNIVLSVGHRDENEIDLGDGNAQQRGKMNNADLAQIIGAAICRALQKEWIHRARCNLDIEQLLDNFYPNFVHQISIQMVFPKDYRQPLF